MRHPTEGVLRRLLDEPAGVADADRGHVADCPDCLATLDAVRTDAALVGAALATWPDGEVDVGIDGGIDVDRAWRRLSATVATAPPQRSPATHDGGWFRSAVRRPVAAALAVVVVLGGAGAAAAAGWLPIFRTEQIAPVSLRTADLVTLPDLRAYGAVTVTAEADVHPVPDAAAAAAETGLDVPEVTALPGGVTGEPDYQVGGQVSATFRFSADRAAAAAAAAGETLPPPPAGLDGSRVRLVAGPGVAQVWASSVGAPALLVGRAVAPTAFSSGVPFETVRDYLLTLPGLPDEVAGQLRRFTADGTTLPLPVPSDQVTTSPAQVDGEPATVLQTRDRTLAAVVWVADGVITVVAGSLDADEVVAIAGDLR